MSVLSFVMGNDVKLRGGEVFAPLDVVLFALCTLSMATDPTNAVCAYRKGIRVCMMECTWRCLIPGEDIAVIECVFECVFWLCVDLWREGCVCVW